MTELSLALINKRTTTEHKVRCMYVIIAKETRSASVQNKTNLFFQDKDQFLQNKDSKHKLGRD